MSKPLYVQIIERARVLIEDKNHWCRGGLARDAYGLSVPPTDSGASKRCAFGASAAAAFKITGDLHQVHDLAIRGMGPSRGIATLVAVNDTRGHAAVLALFDEAMVAT